MDLIDMYNIVNEFLDFLDKEKINNEESEE